MPFTVAQPSATAADWIVSANKHTLAALCCGALPQMGKNQRTSARASGRKNSAARLPISTMEATRCGSCL